MEKFRSALYTGLLYKVISKVCAWSSRSKGRDYRSGIVLRINGRDIRDRHHQFYHIVPCIKFLLANIASSFATENGKF